MPKFSARSMLLKLGLLALTVIVGYAASGMALRAFTLKREAEEARRRLAELTERKQELEKRLRELDTVEVIEREAKARLNLKRPGEEVVVVVPEEESPPPASPAAWWERLRIYFSALLNW